MKGAGEMAVSIHLFDRSTDTRHYGRGDIVFRAGEAGNVMYAVVDGEVDILVSGRVVETAGPGSVIGELALVTQHTRSATAQARSGCTLTPVDKRAFDFLLEEHPTFALTMMRLIAERLERMNAFADVAVRDDPVAPQDDLHRRRLDTGRTPKQEAFQQVSRAG
jgi:CRP-like cAMP-binding protein